MRYIVDDDGVVLDELDENSTYAKIGIGDRVLRKGTIEYLEDTVPIKFRFIKLNINACEELADYAVDLFHLIKYVDFATGILSFSNGRKVRPRHLAKILRRKRRSGSQVIAEFIEKDIIHKHKDENTFYYTMNPYLLLRSKRITRTLYEEFKNTRYRNLEVED